MNFHFRSRFWRDLFLCPDCGTTSAFSLNWTVLLFRPPAGCHVFVHVLLPSSLHSLSLHLTWSSFLSLHYLSLSLSLSLFFLSLESRLSLSLSLLLVSLLPNPLHSQVCKVGARFQNLFLLNGFGCLTVIEPALRLRLGAPVGAPLRTSPALRA